MQDNPLMNIPYRLLEVLLQEVRRWIEAVLKDAFDPNTMMRFLSAMGVDMSQLARVIGLQG